MPSWRKPLFSALRPSFVPRAPKGTKKTPQRAYIEPTAADIRNGSLQRLHVLWRVCREHARLKGLVSTSETLVSRLSVVHYDEQKQLWHVPTSATHTSVPSPLLQLFEGLPIFPDTPKHSGWAAAMSVLAEDMGIDPERTEQALTRFDEFGPWEIEQWEQTLVHEAVDRLDKQSFFYAARSLSKDYGLTHIEAGALLYLSRAELVSSQLSVDEARAVMNHRLENLFHKANRIGDVNTALRVLKVQAVIQGLSRGEVDNIDRDFRTTIREIATKQESVPRIANGS